MGVYTPSAGNMAKTDCTWGDPTNKKGGMGRGEGGAYLFTLPFPRGQPNKKNCTGDLDWVPPNLWPLDMSPSLWSLQRPGALSPTLVKPNLTNPPYKPPSKPRGWGAGTPSPPTTDSTAKPDSTRENPLGKWVGNRAYKNSGEPVRP